MPYAITCTHCDRAILTTSQLTPTDWSAMRGHLTACPNWHGPLPPATLGDVLMNFRVRRVADTDSVAPKPICKLKDAETQFSILFRVRDTLTAAGERRAAEEFLARAHHCRCCEEILQIARNYVEID
jgi:hypothetical protein